jgi:glucose/arabinose dehydrogenase
MKNLLLSICLIFLAKFSFTQISLVDFSTGYTSPVDIKNCGDDRLFIVEQPGQISICDTDGVRRSAVFLNISDRVQYGGEQGLLGLAFPPDYDSSHCFYVDYTRKPDGRTRISRFHLMPGNNDKADSLSEEILLTIYQPYSNHNGGHVAFGPDGYLYIGMGDGGSGGDPGNRAQNSDSLLGKILRLDVNPSVPTYNIPPTNVFASDTTLGRAEIWALGVRNPWRWNFDRTTGDMWIADVGQNAVEEIDFIPAGSPSGLNFGWRCWEGMSPYSTSTGCLPLINYALPVFAYNHTPGGYCSISGGYIYRGAKYQDLYGKYFFADYCNSQIQYLSDSSAPFTRTNLGLLGATSVTTFGEDKNGELYLSSNANKIMKIISSDCAPVATINTGRDTVTDCGNLVAQLEVPFDSTHSYEWNDGANIVSTTATYTATAPATYHVTVSKQGCMSTDSVVVQFIQPVTFTGLDTMICVYHSPITLVPSIPGGTFSGPGIFGTIFFPTQVGVGTYDIVYSYSNGNCLMIDTQTVVVDQCAGIPEPWVSTLKIIPNPSSGNFNVSAFTYTVREVEIKITDIAGRLVVKKSIMLNTGENLIPFEYNISKGIYHVIISDEKQSDVMKLVVE